MAGRLTQRTSQDGSTNSGFTAKGDVGYPNGNEGRER